MKLASRMLAGALLILGLCASTALAKERYASPTGTNNSLCLLSGPCDIVTAINSAGVGDDVTIETGTYGSPSAPISTVLSPTLGNSAQVTIHGQAGQPMPVIYSDAAPGIEFGDGSTLSDVDVEDSTVSPGLGAVFVRGASAHADHIVAHATGSGGPDYGCLIIGQLTDSVCWGSGTSDSGALVTDDGPASQTAFFYNDTVIGSGAGNDGLVIGSGGSNTVQMNAQNTIIQGTGVDVYEDASGSSTVNFNANYSDYATIEKTGLGTTTATSPGTLQNQAGAPLFANAAAGNFHEVSGSPTVDAGLDDPADDGASDLDGGPRIVGTHTDIGAYEFVPAPACSTATGFTGFETATTIQLHCTDSLGTSVTYAIAGQPAHGSASVNALTGVVTYTPGANFSGSDSFTYTGNNAHGSSAAELVSVTVAAEPALVLSHASHVPNGFAFTLDEPASVKVTFTRIASGRRVHGRCVAQTKHNRHARSCHRTLTYAGPTVAAGAGVQTIAFSGRLPNGHTLPRGTYTVTITATDASGQSSSQVLKLKVR